MQKILFVIPSLEYSGAARQFLLLLSHLPRQEFEAHVSVLGQEGPWAKSLTEAGVPIEFLHADGLKEGTYVTAAWGSLGAINKAPHPNAAKVYMDWLLSKEGQEGISKASGYPSRRLDASTAGLPDAVIPKPGVEYQENAKEKYVVLRDEIITYLKTIIPA